MRQHKVEPGFAFTYNKLQGATLERLILVLNDHSKTKLGRMTLQKLFVALSRVRMGKHLAVFPCRTSDLQYLTKLKNSDKLLAWATNYAEPEGTWKPGILLFGDVTALFEKVRQTGGLVKAKKTALRTLCGKLGIYHTRGRRCPRCASR